MVVHEGRTNFSGIAGRSLAAGRQDRLVYYAFDLIWRDSLDLLRNLPQIERKQMLRWKTSLMRTVSSLLPVLYSDHLVGDGQQMFEHAGKLNFEGIVSKRADAPYLVCTN